MKKIKIVLHAAAITAAFVGALASHYYTQPQLLPQYIPSNGTWIRSGEYGVDYKCYDAENTCTFYRPDSLHAPNKFLPSRKGLYVPINNKLNNSGIIITTTRKPV